MPDKRHLQIGEKIKRILADMALRGDFDFALRELFSINEARVSRGYESALVFVSSVAPGRSAFVAEALQKAAPRIRHLLASEAGLRSTPALKFQADESQERAGRIESLLASSKD
ncbi:MAG: 30S ribosome-binding factor RbfA [Rickettsiales bacterium]|jgi:ribosome-binding factor A|nr:30S ribosome-binding factor RbfA [Rickettsiales bacterium]